MTASVRPCTIAENSPCSERIAARAASREPASMRSAMDFGLREIELVVEERALRELARAARGARRAPARARSPLSTTTGPPWPCSSSTCSPVYECGRGKEEREAGVDRLLLRIEEAREGDARAACGSSPEHHGGDLGRLRARRRARCRRHRAPAASPRPRWCRCASWRDRLPSDAGGSSRACFAALRRLDAPVDVPLLRDGQQVFVTQ